MGQKVNPNGIRLKIVRAHNAKWYAGREYAKNLYSDIQARRFLEKKLYNAGVSRVLVERPAKNLVVITIFVARPGMVIGKSGGDADQLRSQLTRILGVPVHINIKEVRKPELNAKLVAQTVAQQLEKRIMFRRAMKRAVSSALRAGAKGIKIKVSGRLGGAEIARSEWYREGRVPLHTFRADIDYGTAEAKTTYGIIGVKIWIYKGEVFSRHRESGTKKESAMLKANEV